MSILPRLLFALLLLAGASIASPAAELTVVDSNVAGFATFNSNTQKIARNRHGTLISYQKSRNEAFTAQVNKFVLISPVGQQTEILSETWATNPPCLAASGAGEFFAAFPNWSDNTLRIYIWRDISASSTPEVYVASLHGDGKYACAFDEVRRTLYYVGISGTLVRFRVDGIWHDTVQIWSNGANPAQYPAMHITRDGSLHVFQNSVTGQNIHYRSVQYMTTPNGGGNWYQSWTPTQITAPLTLPVGSDESSTSMGMSRGEDIIANTFMIATLADDTTFRAVWLFAPGFAEKCFAVEFRCSSVYIEHARSHAQRTVQQVPIRAGDGHVLRPRGGGALLKRRGAVYFITTEQTDLVLLRVEGGGMAEVERTPLPAGSSSRCPYALSAFSGQESDSDIIGTFTMLHVGCAEWANSTSWQITGELMKFRITVP